MGASSDRSWLRSAAALLAGIVFGVGLAVAQMIDPDKVLGFLDVAGAWDASLLFVLGAAVGVATLAFRYVLSAEARSSTRASICPRRPPSTAGW